MRGRRRLFALLVALSALVGCGGATSPTGTPRMEPTATTPSASPVVSEAPSMPSSPSVAPSPSEVGSVGPFPAAGCPVADPAFCTPAAAVAEAIVMGDAAAIAELSRPDVFTCKDLDVAMFKGCATAETLEGHPVGTVSGSIDVLDPTDYRAALAARMQAIDPSFTDEAGSGEARVLGTSACGPADPSRRSYYVAWTAALPAATGGSAQRMVGLYEFTFRDDRWLVGILYLDTLDAWTARNADPLRDVGCGVTPWSGG